MKRLAAFIGVLGVLVLAGCSGGDGLTPAQEAVKACGKESVGYLNVDNEADRIDELRCGDGATAEEEPSTTVIP